jgi:hypothetical protein
MRCCVIFGNIIYTVPQILTNEYNTRRKDKFHVPNRNTSTFNMGIKLYNRLPLKLRKSGGFKVFKHKLTLFLLDYSFCTLHEFLSKRHSSTFTFLYFHKSIQIEDVEIVMEDSRVYSSNRPWRPIRL